MSLGGAFISQFSNAAPATSSLSGRVSTPVVTAAPVAAAPVATKIYTEPASPMRAAVSAPAPVAAAPAPAASASTATHFDAYNPATFGGLTRDQLAQFAQTHGMQLAGNGGAIYDAIMASPQLQDSLVNYLVDQQITSSQSDPSYGSLTKPPYTAYTPYSGTAPTFTPLTADIVASDPGYQFTLDEGHKAIDRASAARGGFYSGAALKEAAKFATGTADQTFNDANTRNIQNYQTQENSFVDRNNINNQNFTTGYNQASNDSNNLFSRLTGVIGLGTGATNTQVNANANNSDTLGTIYGQTGQVQASGALAQGNNVNNTMSGILRSSFGTSSYAPLPWQQPGYTNPSTGRSY